MALKLVFHGGKCCGIKTIYGFTIYGGGGAEPEIESLGRSHNHDQNGSEVESDLPFFTGSAPAESTEERLARYIGFCKTRRPQGAIEITLARSRYGDFSQVKAWGPTLERLGFKVSVPEFLNSNSGNFVTIYHLVYDEGPDPDEDEDEDDYGDEDPCDCEECRPPNPFGRST